MELFVNDLTVIDFSYCCQQRGIVGESWIVDVELSGSLNDMSMVLDFGVVKKQIKNIIDDAVDHKLVIPNKNKSITSSNSTFHQNHLFVDFSSDKGSYHLQSPKSAFAFIDCAEITIETLTKHLTNVIMEQLPTNVNGLVISLRPENITTPFYHYTHGLKLHDGNCQRIAHGHRSMIQIIENGKRSEKLEQQWANRWEDIYIASECDKIEKQQCQLSKTAEQQLTPKHKYFAYVAPQGRFDIAVVENVLDIVDCDSTIELLTDFICRQLKLKYPENQFKVIGYEGVGKGAISHG